MHLKQPSPLVGSIVSQPGDIPSLPAPSDPGLLPSKGPGFFFWFVWLFFFFKKQLVTPSPARSSQPCSKRVVEGLIHVLRHGNSGAPTPGTFCPVSLLNRSFFFLWVFFFFSIFFFNPLKVFAILRHIPMAGSTGRCQLCRNIPQTPARCQQSVRVAPGWTHGPRMDTRPRDGHMAPGRTHGRSRSLLISRARGVTAQHGCQDRRWVPWVLSR